MITQLLASLIILCLGTLYPAYRSYKALKSRDAREYVKWMMYWIVFAICSLVSSFTDIFLSFWFPFYYELKIIIVFYLLSPTTTGSSVLYRRFVHPWFVRHENRIDDLMLAAKQESYRGLVRVSSRVAHYGSNLALNSVITAHASLENLFYRDQHGPQGGRPSLMTRSQSEFHHMDRDRQTDMDREPSSRWSWFKPLQSRKTPVPSRRRMDSEPLDDRLVEEEYRSGQFMEDEYRRRAQPAMGGQLVEEEFRRRTEPARGGPFMEEEFRRRTEPTGGIYAKEEEPLPLGRRNGRNGGTDKRMTASNVSIRRMMEEEDKRAKEDSGQMVWQSCSSGEEGGQVSGEEDMASDYGSEISEGKTEVAVEKKIRKKVISKKKKVKPLRRSLRRFSMTL